MKKLRRIETTETMIKLLKEGNYLYGNETERKTNGINDIYLYNKENQIIAIAPYYSYFWLLFREQQMQILRQFDNNEMVKIEYKDCKRYLEKEKQRLEKKDKISKNKTLKENAYKAIEYFKGWQEGDSITITADFMKNVEAIVEYLESLKK